GREFTYVCGTASAYFSLSYNPSFNLCATSANASTVYFTSSKLCEAVGINRKIIMPFGITGYNTAEQKMPYFSRISYTTCDASCGLPLKITGVTGEVVFPI